VAMAVQTLAVAVAALHTSNMFLVAEGLEL
jgi:hypothetical protein